MGIGQSFIDRYRAARADPLPRKVVITYPNETGVPQHTLLITDWDSGSLGQWSADSGITTLASGFKGPADFAVAPNSNGLLVVVPDLVKSELRLIQLGQ